MSAEIEGRIRAASERGDRAAAVTALLEGYGAELLGYLTATLRNQEQAREVYSMLAEDLWRGILGFQWRATARAWAYTLARNARSRYLLDEGRRAAQERALSEIPWLDELVERTRTSTPLYRRSEVHSQFRALREHLDEPDQTLLMLRVDRRLSWKELAVVLGETSGEDALDSARAAARLRTRFQALKAKLRALAQDRGILPDAREA